jgi:cytoskeleton protein RodZ
MADNDTQYDQDSGSTAEPDLGQTLRSARETRGLSIEDIATELRIGAHLLTALEAGDFEKLGAPVFAKGYLKQYGARLGLEYDDLLSQYYAVVDRSEVDIAPSRTIKLRDERQITVWVIAALVIALLAVFLFVWWIDQPDVQTTGRTVTPATNTEPVVSLPPPESGADAAPGAGTNPAPAESGAGLAAPAQAFPTGTVPGGAEGATVAAVTNPAGAEGARAQTEAPATEEPAATAAVGSVSAAASDDRTVVELAFAADCWTEISDATGERLFYGLGESGMRRRLSGIAPIRVLLGDLSAATLTVDGRAFPIPESGRQGNLARFTIDSPAN